MSECIFYIVVIIIIVERGLKCVQTCLRSAWLRHSGNAPYIAHTILAASFDFHFIFKDYIVRANITQQVAFAASVNISLGIIISTRYHNILKTPLLYGS